MNDYGNVLTQTGGAKLPSKFSKSLEMFPSADLLIVMGTSLTVHPFASLTQLVQEDCPRMLINMETAGDIGSRLNDVVALGDCDSVVQELCRELGWGDELEQLWGETATMNLVSTMNPKKNGGETKMLGARWKKLWSSWRR